MNAKLNALNTSLSEVLASLNATAKELVSSVNDKKTEILALLDGISADCANIKEVGKICATAGAILLDAADACDDLCDLVNTNMPDWADIPTGPIETFLGYCTVCGKEVHAKDDHEIIDQELYCGECHAAVQAAIEQSEVAVNV
jgi:hypothetical protein